ncbi:uncharacterized protein PFL1_02237 [Pseudozyma flocculosa PF-1]|uniref:Uncharacterized protein n=1 Tax=Pseudozyma flocculosa TaxID=84751 RepID=A0A5C3FF17_9BASI|nr:uncharacterized protein PFL1_02237 [Pseudozyma flocculosa PF-1]EPQ30120.1 hypothetical protein PFL1_02237 [Pseudozyma flocculosa PF-1]SPO42267.1 uncharacterized protein PSFLO_07750 [Pseudozyma flocculosa]
MASLSTYASRFLASGLGASIRPGQIDDTATDASQEPLFYGQASVTGAPFSHDRNDPYGPEYSLSSSDGLPPAPSVHKHHGRPVHQSGLLHSLTGASRYGPASFIGAGRGRGTGGNAGGGGGVRDSLIREIDDEEDVDLWRDERRMTDIASRLGASTGSEGLHPSHEDERRQERTRGNASAATGGDTQDPFLADGDLDRDESSSIAESRGRGSVAGRSSATSPSRIYAQPASAASAAGHQLSPAQVMGRAKGWLAHGSIAESVLPADRKGKGRQNSQGRGGRGRKEAGSSLSRLPNDIYRDPDLDEEGSAPASRYGTSSASHHVEHEPGRRSRERGGHRSRGPGLYSIYDEEDESEGELSGLSRSRSTSISASSVTDSGTETDDGRPRQHRKTHRSSKRPQVNRNRTRNMSSTMRDPLLPLGGSRHHGRRSSESESDEGSVMGSDRDDIARKDEEDTAIYVYPSPPARSGWGPWANRLAVGKYKDKTAIVCFAGAVAAIVLFGLAMSWGVNSPSPPKTPKTRPSSYYTITRSLPILILMTLFAFGAGLGNLLLLRNFGRLGGAQILRTGLMAVPIVLGLGWTWALAGSFIYDDEGWSGGGWSTTGLRVISIIPLGLAVVFARMVWSRRKALNKSIAVIELCCGIVLDHPALLVLSVASLGAFLVLTIPFLFIFTRLFLVGHFSKPVGDSVEWKTDRRAAWLAWATLATWLWTWAVLRGVQRVTVAGVVSHWYFHRNSAARGQEGQAGTDKRQPDDEHSDYVYGEDDGDSIYGPGPSAPGAYGPNTAASAGRSRSAGSQPSAEPDPTEIVRASFARATGPALGSICLAALILSIVRTLTVIAETARRASEATAQRRTPKLLQPLTHVVAFLAGLGTLVQGFSNLTLVYVGITGEGFWAATKKSVQTVGRRGMRGALEGLIINLVLDLTAIALSFLCGIAGFLFSAHQLHVPADAPLVGLLCAVVPYWTLRLCADVLTNAADTLYLCYAIDSDAETGHAHAVGEALKARPDTTGSSILPF